MKRGRLIIIGFLAALGIGGALVMAVLHKPEPSFQGKSLSEWLENYERVVLAQSPLPWPRSPYPTEALEAVRSMGQPAVDILLDRMNASDPAWKLKLVSLARKQSLFKVQFQPANRRRSVAVAVLGDLGSSVSNAVPTLVARLSDESLGDTAASLLAGIGRASVEPLQARLAHKDPKVRRQAAQILGWIGPDAASAVPQLIHSLSDTNEGMRGSAIRALGAIGVPHDEIELRLIGLLHVPEDALDAACGLVAMGSNNIPLLTRALTNEHAAVRVAGLGGLRFWRDYRRRAPADRERNPVQWRQRTSSGLDLKTFQGTLQQLSAGEHQAQVSALIGNLDDPNPRVRELSAAMLAGFPTESARSVPVLDLCLGDPDAVVRAAARRSMERLIKSHRTKPTSPKAGASSAPLLGPDAVVAPSR